MCKLYSVFLILILSINEIATLLENPGGDVDVEAVKTSLDFETLGLNLHNQLREKHGVAPLRLNATLSSAAQAFADYLISSQTFKNKLSPGYIKNLYQYKGTPAIAQLDAMEHAVKKWYNTVQIFNWKNPGPSPFSAMIWKSTTDVGFGLSMYEKRTIIVAAFSPPGNILGDNGDHFKDNVFRALH